MINVTMYLSADPAIDRGICSPKACRSGRRVSLQSARRAESANGQALQQQLLEWREPGSKRVRAPAG